MTAHQRLGQIALARGELDNARDHLLATYAVSPRRRPVRQMLGEIIAVQGYLEQAAELRHVKNLDSGQLDGRRFWYEQENDGTAFARLVAAIQAWQANKLAQ